MTTVRIAHAEPWPGRQPGGGFAVFGFLIVLADDPGGRALPMWLSGPEGHGVWEILDPSAEQHMPFPPPGGEDVTVELLRTAGITVTGVDIDELDAALTVGPPGSPPVGPPPWGLPEGPPPGAPPPEGPRPGGSWPQGTARIEFASALGPQHIMTVPAGYALALAAGTGAPVRVSDAVMTQLAVPVHGGDLLGPFLRGPRFEPRNLAFADGLAGWDFGGSFRQDADESHWADYSCAAEWGAEGGSAVLSSAAPEPYGFAGLAQTIFGGDYQGRTVVFRGELRTRDVAGQCGLHILTGNPRGPVSAPGRLAVPLAGSQGWTRQEVTADVPARGGLIQFGMFLYGRGRVELRDTELTFTA